MPCEARMNYRTLLHSSSMVITSFDVQSRLKTKSTILCCTPRFVSTFVPQTGNIYSQRRREILPCPEHDVFGHVAAPEPLDATSAPPTPYPDHWKKGTLVNISNFQLNRKAYGKYIAITNTSPGNCRHDFFNVSSLQFAIIN